jgi:RNA polymerase sigma factor (sigma-70 family)
MNTEDEYFIQKCLNGESEAFGFLVDKYKASVYYFLLSRLRNVHDAEDVSQKVFLRAYEKLGHLRRWESFAKWLYSIAYTQCRNFIRERQNRPDSEYFEEQDPGVVINHSMDSYYEDQANESLKETVEEALSSLPEIYREVLVLHYIGGMKNKEIAIILGTSIDNIKQRLSRARSMLKEEVLAMMNVAYDQQKLTAKFTFNIMETIKKLKIHPITQSKGLPWGLSLATGIIIAIMSINPGLIPFIDIGTPIYAPLPSETKVLRIGEIPVDIVKISNISYISSNMGKGNGGEPKKPDTQNAFFMSPQAEGGEWTKKAEMPTGRAGMASAVVDGKIYVIAGWGGDFLATLEMYDPKLDRWEAKASLPYTNYAFTASAVNGKIYAIGGWPGNDINTVEEYNPATDKWTKKADMPTVRGFTSAAVVDGIIYVIGGSNSASLSVVEAYDPVADKWSRKADIPLAGRYRSAAIGNKIYSVGGENSREMCGISSCPQPYLYEYDTVLDKWTKKAEITTAKAGMSMDVIDGKIYVVGGDAPTAARDDIVQTFLVEIYDPGTDTWKAGVNLPDARRYHCSSVIGGKLYIIGGWPSSADLAVTSKVEVFDAGLATSVSPQGKLTNTWGTIKAK